MPRKPTSLPPEFFIDRSLGRIYVAERLRALGFVVHTMAEVYPDTADEDVSDVEWIRHADTSGWVALTKDERIIRDADEQDALWRSRLRVFALGNQHLTGPEMADYFEANIHRIVQRCRKRGPFVDVVRKDRVERRWPKG